MRAMISIVSVDLTNNLGMTQLWVSFVQLGGSRLKRPLALPGKQIRRIVLPAPGRCAAHGAHHGCEPAPCGA